MKLSLITCFVLISVAGFTQQIKATYTVKVKDSISSDQATFKVTSN